MKTCPLYELLRVCYDNTLHRNNLHVLMLDPNIQPYLHYLPVPMIDTEECNSTKHYNGRISGDQICAGYTDAEKTPCYVSWFYKIYLFLN